MSRTNVTVDVNWLYNMYPKYIQSGYYKPISGSQLHKPAPSGALIIDFTRRNGPETKHMYDILRWHVKYDWPGRYEDIVLIFWTKSPKQLVKIYHEMIMWLQEKGVTVLCFVTHNGYFYPIEPGASREGQDLAELVALLGPNAVRLRFDPIILGKGPDGSKIPIMEHWKYTADEANTYNIQHIVINFIVPTYKNARSKLKSLGYTIADPSYEKKKEVLLAMLSVLPDHIHIRGCAESYMFADDPDLKGKLLPAACSDPEWAILVNSALKDKPFNGRRSRRGKGIKCGCTYWSDLGIYRNMGLPNVDLKCPVNCVECYAQNNSPVYTLDN